MKAINPATVNAASSGLFRIPVVAFGRNYGQHGTIDLIRMDSLSAKYR
jgi:hypothetical protein